MGNNKVIVKNVRICIDADRTEKITERIAAKEELKPIPAVTFETVRLHGKGVKVFLAEWGHEMLNDIMAAPVMDSWLKKCLCPSNGALTVQDLFDELPVGATVGVNAELCSGYSEGTVSLLFVKEKGEEKEGLALASLRVIDSVQNI